MCNQKCLAEHKYHYFIIQNVKFSLIIIICSDVVQMKINLSVQVQKVWVVKLVKNHNHINCTGKCLSGNSEVFLPVMLCDFSFSDFVFQMSLLIHLSIALIQGVLTQLTHFYWNISRLHIFHKLHIWKPSVYLHHLCVLLLDNAVTDSEPHCYSAGFVCFAPYWAWSFIWNFWYVSCWLSELLLLLQSMFTT